MRLLRGKKIAEVILRNLKRKIAKGKIKPGLAVVLVGKNQASNIYVSLKRKAAEEIGMNFKLSKFSERVSQDEIIKVIKRLNADQEVNGIIVQLPLPKKYETQKIIDAIDPRKDADGFHPQSLKAFLVNKADVFPVLPKAILNLLVMETKLKHALVIANSEKFGKIMIAALKTKKIRGRHILVKNLKKSQSAIRQADIIISAVGRPGLIRGAMIKAGAILIDAGITKKGKHVFGDVDQSSVKKIAAYITPVPGGVGPVTIACLLENTYLLFKKQA